MYIINSNYANYDIKYKKREIYYFSKLRVMYCTQHVNAVHANLFLFPSTIIPNCVLGCINSPLQVHMMHVKKILILACFKIVK
jgi:hypothetical protein